LRRSGEGLRAARTQARSRAGLREVPGARRRIAVRIQGGRAALWSLPVAGLAASLAAFPSPPVAGREKVVVRGDLGRRIDDYMTHLEGYGFAGALLVAKDGQVVLAKGYGLADRERRIRVTPDTVFDIGS